MHSTSKLTRESRICATVCAIFIPAPFVRLCLFREAFRPFTRPNLVATLVDPVMNRRTERYFIQAAPQTNNAIHF